MGMMPTDQQLFEWLLMRMLQTYGEVTEQQVRDVLGALTPDSWGTSDVAALAQGLARDGHPVAVTMVIRLEARQ